MRNLLPCKSFLQFVSDKLQIQIPSLETVSSQEQRVSELGQRGYTTFSEISKSMIFRRAW